MTQDEIDAAATPAGGWTRATLASWGVPWPPPKGWRKALTAQGIEAGTGETAGLDPKGESPVRQDAPDHIAPPLQDTGPLETMAICRWQPIETAPKDGTRVKLLIPYNRQMFTEAQCTDEGHWDANATSEGLIGFDEIEVGCWRFDGDDGPFDLPPTHWQPLPEAPLNTKEGE